MCWSQHWHHSMEMQWQNSPKQLVWKWKLQRRERPIVSPKIPSEIFWWRDIFRVTTSTLSVKKQRVEEYFGIENYWCLCVLKNSYTTEKSKRAYIKIACKFWKILKIRLVFNKNFRFGFKIPKTISSIWWSRIWCRIFIGLQTTTWCSRTYQ